MATKMTEKNNRCQCYSIELEDGIYSECDTPCGNIFAQGHDAKLKSVLIRCHLAGIDYMVRAGGAVTSAEPMEVARQRGWAKFLLKAEESRQRKEEARQARIERKTSNKTERKAKAETGATERLALLDAMKQAARIVKEQGLDVKVTRDNYQAILDGAATATSTPAPEAGAKFRVGQEVKVPDRGRLIPATVLEVAGDRLRVQITFKNGKVTERVLEASSIR